MSGVVDCLLSLRDHMNSGITVDGIYDATKCGSQSRKKWNLSERDRLEPLDVSQGNQRQLEPNSLIAGDERKWSNSELKFQSVMRNPTSSGIVITFVL